KQKDFSLMREKIGNILVRLGYITDEQLHFALAKQEEENFKRRIGDILLEMVLKEQELAHALSVQFNLPLAQEQDFPQDIPLPELSYEFLKKHNIFPLRVEDGTVDVAISDPLSLEALDKLQAGTGLKARAFIAPRGLILRKLDSVFASHDTLMKTAIEDAQESLAGIEEEVDHLKDLAQEKGIIKLVNLIIENAVNERASDIHIEPEEELLRVRYRIDGVLYERDTLPLRMHPAVASRIKLLAGMNIAERRLPQDGRIEGTFGSREVDIRVSTIPTVHGESIVMRLLDRERAFISLENLGFDDELLKKYERIIKLPYGMVLITGPTGSGKSTTLYATLDRINSSEKKIITVEEPVEYVIRGVNQIQVRPKIGLTFATGLRHILRQDPDIVMVGEIRDPETASIAVHAALTGHLLFSTLHTNDSASAVTRLTDMGVENYLVSS
ncbi:MAG: type II secretion system protein GspE, partial [Nitrospirae bacterium]